MYKQLHDILTVMGRDQKLGLLANGSIGLEKESLRVDLKGKLSQRPHPQKLGSALTNPYITTDYSEALLELITPPIQGVVNARDFLHKIHKFVYAHLEDEYMWAASMPELVPVQP